MIHSFTENKKYLEIISTHHFNILNNNNKINYCTVRLKKEVEEEDMYMYCVHVHMYVCERVFEIEREKKGKEIKDFVKKKKKSNNIYS